MSEDKCPNCDSKDVRVDDSDRPDFRLEGYCFTCKYEWRIDTKQTQQLLTGDGEKQND